MKFYLAPLEGITGYIFRNAIHEYYGEGVDKYFTPFLMPHTKCSFNTKEKNDISPENNKDRTTIVQVLTNSSEDFLFISKDIMELGYNEININLGCPSGTVASKKRGAGFLDIPDKLDQFLYEIFEKKDDSLKISLKTRIGIDEPEEFYDLLNIYNKYHLEELIIHPRVLKEYYKGKPHKDIFAYAIEHSKNPLVYNGDINSVEDYQKLIEEMGTPDIFTGVMCGRGVLQNPALITELHRYDTVGEKEKSFDWNQFRLFHNRLRNEYMTTMSGDVNVLYKMKEIWAYMIVLFPGCEKQAKAIRKATRLSEYDAAVNTLFRQI